MRNHYKPATRCAIRAIAKRENRGVNARDRDVIPGEEKEDFKRDLSTMVRGAQKRNS